MNDLLTGLVSTLVASFLTWLIYQKWQSSRPSQPIEFTVEQFADDCWVVGFPEKHPNIKSIDGIRMSAIAAYSALLKGDAVDVNQTKLRIRLRALVDAPVLIKRILIETEKCEPLSGARICCLSAGSNSATILVANLDETSPSVWEAREEDTEIIPTGAHPYFSRKSITLTKDEYETLILVGTASRFCVSWRVRIEFETGGHSGFITVDSKGMPFRTTGEPANGYATDLEWAWHDGHRIVQATN